MQVTEREREREKEKSGGEKKASRVVVSFISFMQVLPIL